ncbi:papain-like cysteine protease family protein [Rhizobium laguerreae]|uniref:papain-like cysteine protease family protein n=1 Tax=Rhizobium laguerreae TaxID=1076926 RepID=UPI001C8FF3F1|nr:hypothetical protein [Rhizobium laguerreae]MBY3187911.1 hypothetical protein [Rhizobium laguerreae]
MPLPSFLNAKNINLGLQTTARSTRGGAARSKKLSLSIALQEQSNWCWAAVSHSISQFYDSASAWTQCKIVNEGLDRQDCCGSAASNRVRCNVPWYLDRALSLTSNFVDLLTAHAPAPAMSFAAIQTQINKGTAVCTRVGWTGGGGHFQAIVGWTIGSSGDEYIVVSDPIYKETTILVRDFAASYQAGGKWTHAYLTAPAPTRDAAGGAGTIPQAAKRPAYADPDLVGA